MKGVELLTVLIRWLSLVTLFLLINHSVTYYAQYGFFEQSNETTAVEFDEADVNSQPDSLLSILNNFEIPQSEIPEVFVPASVIILLILTIIFFVIPNRIANALYTPNKNEQLKILSLSAYELQKIGLSLLGICIILFQSQKLVNVLFDVFTSEYMSLMDYSFEWISALFYILFGMIFIATPTRFVNKIFKVNDHEIN